MEMVILQAFAKKSPLSRRFDRKESLKRLMDKCKSTAFRDKQAQRGSEPNKPQVSDLR